MSNNRYIRVIGDRSSCRIRCSLSWWREPPFSPLIIPPYSQGYLPAVRIRGRGALSGRDPARAPLLLREYYGSTARAVVLRTPYTLVAFAPSKRKTDAAAPPHLSCVISWTSIGRHCCHAPPYSNGRKLSYNQEGGGTRTLSAPRAGHPLVDRAALTGVPLGEPSLSITTHWKAGTYLTGGRNVP